MKRHRALIVAVLFVLAPAAGCGGEGKQVIRTAAEGRQYLDDVIGGAGLSARAADDAPLAAKLAVAQAEGVARIRQILDNAAEPDSGVSQACTAIGVAADSADFIPPPPRIDEVLPQLRQYPGAVPDEDAFDLVERLRQLAGNDVFKLVDAACEAA